jgi:hypothetical protein
VKEIQGSNLIAEIEQTMQMLMKPTSSHRMAALTAVLGSKGAHQSIHQYKDNDVTTSLANAKHSKYAVYRKEMGNPIA